MLRYCAYFGLSAPMLLFASRATIDSIFDTNVINGVNALLANLEQEVLALQAILDTSADKANNIPRLVMEASAEKATAFIERLNSRIDACSTASDASGTNLFTNGATHINSIRAARLFLLNKGKKLFTPDVYSAILTELNTLPLSPTGGVLRDGKSAQLSQPATKALQAIYAASLKEVEGLKKLDYVLLKIRECLSRTSANTYRVLNSNITLFSKKEQVLSERSCLKIVSNALSDIESSSHIESSKGAIRRAISSCEALLSSDTGQFIDFDLIPVTDLEAQVLHQPSVIRAYIRPESISELLYFFKAISAKMSMDDLIFFSLVYAANSEFEMGQLQFLGLFQDFLAATAGLSEDEISSKKDSYCNAIGRELALSAGIAGIGVCALNFFKATYECISSITVPRPHLQDKQLTTLITLLQRHLKSLYIRTYGGLA